MTQQPTPKDEPTNMTTCGLCGAPRPMATTCKNCPMPKQEQPGSFEKLLGGDMECESRVFEYLSQEQQETLLAAHNSTLEAAKREANLEGSIEAAEQILWAYRVGKSLNFAQWLPGQIEDWKDELANLPNNAVTKGEA